MTILRLKHDNSPKRMVGNKPWYLVNEKTDTATDHMTWTQIELVIRSMRSVGIVIQEN